MNDRFLVREGWRELQLGRSRERQLDKFDFLDSMEIFIEYLFCLARSSIKYEMSDFVSFKPLTLVIYMLIVRNEQKTHEMTVSTSMTKENVFKHICKPPEKVKAYYKRIKTWLWEFILLLKY